MPVPACLSTCAGPQSSLDPAGPAAAAIAGLGWAMIGGGALILLLVVAGIVLAMRGAPGRLGSVRTVVGGGIALPLVVLPVLLVAGLLVARGNAADGTEPMTIRVTGEQFWWRVEYLDADGVVAAMSANEIHLPVGMPVRLVLESADVIHSFWVPALGGKLDMIPGRSNSMALTAERAGVYRGQCAEFCGDQHALMAFVAVAHPQPEFDAWLANEQAAAIADDTAAGGAAQFLAEGCGACHTVRGTTALGTIGPDLTHVGSRLTIAAGTLANTPENLAHWIAAAQEIKPGSRMPSFDTIAGDDLAAIAAYLASLR